MKKHYRNLLPLLMIAVVGMGFSSCSKDGPTQESFLQKAEGIIKLKTGIGDWDAAYLTKSGYFCQKETLNEPKGNTGGKYQSITFMPANGSEEEIASLISTKADNIPTQLVTRNGILYFSFPNDTILELLYDNGKEVTMLDSIPYSRNDFSSSSASTDAFKSCLSNAASLLRKNTQLDSTGGSLANKFSNIFNEVSNEPYVQDDELVSNITTNQTGDYNFTETINEWYDDEIGNFVCNSLSLWTGKATYKVGGSSCTLSGTIWCPSSEYNTYGTYGIICDADDTKLTLGNAEYEGQGFQSENDLSYGVDFRGLKPNTTYYYRAYYKFNSSDHGSIVPRYGNPTDQVIYDPTIKSFKTGDNILTVDVVMCIDVTGSMSNIINTVKYNAISFYDQFYQCCEEEGIQLAALNAQVIAFRDKNVDTNWLQNSSTYSLPSQSSAFEGFVNGLRADGGGDTPESGLEALQAAFNKSDWGVDDGYHRQVVILWTDAPYLIGSYSSVELSSLKSKWDAMPSGRRLILFAPNGTNGSNSGSWGNLDGWTNLIHETDLSSGFNKFDYILKAIIGELTSKASAPRLNTPAHNQVNFRPNN